MTAGKGIVHAEMPTSFDTPSLGFQLWINLQRQYKYTDPQYQEFTSDQIPAYEKDGLRAKVIAGEVLGVKGPVYTRTPAFYIDFTLAGGQVYEHTIPANWNALAYVYKGELKYKSGESTKTNSAVLFEKSEEDGVISFSADKEASFLLMAGESIAEPIAQYGPFVLNEEAELHKAFTDYSLAKNGFEGADTWNSKIKLLKHRKTASAEF